MKKVVITLQIDTDESDNFIKTDIERELNCCSILPDIVNIDISDNETKEQIC